MYEHLFPTQLQLRGGDPEGYFMIPNWLLAWDFHEPLDAGVIGAPCNLGAATWLGTHEGPNAIREASGLFATRSFDFQTDVRDLRVRDLGDIRTHMTGLTETHANIEATVIELCRLNKSFTPVILGGDCSISLPAARGLRTAREAKLGLIHFAAGEDLREPSGGAAPSAIGELVRTGVVGAENVVHVGGHGYPHATRTRAVRGASRHAFPTRVIRQLGIRHVMTDAVELASSGTDGVYVSLSIDVIDPAFAPGTRMPIPGGLDPWDIFEALYVLGVSERVKALDLVDVDPIRDIKATTSKLAVIAMMSFFVGLRERKFGSTVAGWHRGLRSKPQEAVSP
jgi:formiminoglutamase